MEDNGNSVSKTTTGSPVGESSGLELLVAHETPGAVQVALDRTTKEEAAVATMDPRKNIISTDGETRERRLDTSVDSLVSQLRDRLSLNTSNLMQLSEWRDQLCKLDSMGNLTENLGDPLSMLQGLSPCGAPPGLSRLVAAELMPAPLRHIQSSPNQSTVKSLLQSDDVVPPLPPIVLDPFERSSSTPSSLRPHSFGTADGSAFTLPPSRCIPRVSESGASAFGPVQYYSLALEDMERTAIEVDLSAAEGSLSTNDKKRGAASRAARFLSDVRLLRRRHRGRDKPHLQKSRNNSHSTLDTTVTVISESDFETSSSCVGESNQDEMEQPGADLSLGTANKHSWTLEDAGEPFVDVLQSNLQQLRFALSLDTIAASPSPSRMERLENSSPIPQSNESSPSPQTTTTGSSSGQATQVTGLQSQLSRISETDREVMETNKEAKRRHQEIDAVPATEPDSVCNYSSSSSSTNPSRYFSLASGSSLREGANVATERLFNGSPRQPALALSLTTSTSTAGTTTDPSVGTQTSSSISSTQKPPSVVAYVDHDNSSDMASVRKMSESQRGTDDDREDSPAVGLQGESDLSFEAPTAPASRSARLYRIRARHRLPRQTNGKRPLKTPPPVSPPPRSEQSPPRNIVDHPSSNTPKPSVMRSWLGDNPTMSGYRSELSDDLKALAPTISVDADEVGVNEAVVSTYTENSIEVSMEEDDVDGGITAVVTPDK